MTLDGFFSENPHFALAFSGGADSSFLLYEALRQGCDVLPIYVKSAFQPKFELDDASRLCRELGAELTVVSVDILSCGEVVKNCQRRCYYCKKRLFGAITAKAEENGYTLVIDGTNASDDESGRPGMLALRQLGVQSPLRECGVTKTALREKSCEAGLFTWDKPAYACLATRIKTGETIDAEKLIAIEKSEDYLTELGFRDFRVRLGDGKARLEVLSRQMTLVIRHRERILERLGEYFSEVSLNLKGR